MFSGLIVFLLILIAIISALNTVLEFGERVYNYRKAVKERRKAALSEKLEAPRQLPPAPRLLTQGSYRKGTRLRPNEGYDLDISVSAPPSRAFKKNLLTA